MIYIGLDVGGTFVKGITVNENGEIISEGSVKTLIGEEFADCIVSLADSLVHRSGKVYSDVKGVGVCCPGVISAEGNVIFAGNLKLKNYPLKKNLEERLRVPVKVCNDANAAALGEAKFGAGKEYSDSVLITLGTGVGGGIVIGGKLFEGNKGAGAEIGHMVIERGNAYGRNYYRGGNNPACKPCIYKRSEHRIYTGSPAYPLAKPCRKAFKLR